MPRRPPLGRHTLPLTAQEPAKPAPADKPAPAQANVRYGDHERQVFDFWKADTKEPAPLLFFIHGGGWQNGDKSGIAVAPYLKAGISVVSINYRYVPQAKEAGVSPPVKDEFHAKRDTIKEWIAEYSPYAHVSADDPPVYLFYSAPPAPGKEEKDPTHTANFGVKLQEHSKASGVKCELQYPGAPDAPHANTTAWIIARLKAPK